MGEETAFWGVVVPRPTSTRWPHGTGPLSWPAKRPDGKPLRYYPLFTSSARARVFVHEQGQQLMVENPHLMAQTLANIRRIYRDEIPKEHFVSLDRKGLVTWAELLRER